MRDVALVDYGAGNLHSVRRALERAGASVTVTADLRTLRQASGVVLPGVGSARAAMERLEAGGVADVLRHRAAEARPVLGVCLGMQLLFESSDEGAITGLGVLPGKVVQLRDRPKVPHMGWNQLTPVRSSSLLGEVEPGSFVYFVHSYHVLPSAPEDVAAITDYEGEIVAAVEHEHVWGTQFHPEKSGDAGLRIYRNFVEALG